MRKMNTHSILGGVSTHHTNCCYPTHPEPSLLHRRVHLSTPADFCTEKVARQKTAINVSHSPEAQQLQPRGSTVRFRRGHLKRPSIHICSSVDTICQPVGGDSGKGPFPPLRIKRIMTAVGSIKVTWGSKSILSQNTPSGCATLTNVHETRQSVAK